MALVSHRAASTSSKNARYLFVGFTEDHGDIHAESIVKDERHMKRFEMDGDLS